MQVRDEIAIFVRAVDLGSFAAVALESNLTTSAVARIVTRLENKLGVKLLHRTTRRLVLTQEGSQYLPHARTVLAAVEAATTSVIPEHKPQGHLRINTGSAFAKHKLVKALPRFFAQYPNITVELGVSDQRIDPILDQIDLTIRVGPLPDSDLILRRLGIVKRLIVASPSYLERMGTPRTPTDLAQHNCLKMTGFTRLSVWPFWQDGEREMHEVQGNLQCDSAETLLDLALLGVGIVRLGDFLGEEAVQDGRLIQLLTDCHDNDPTPISALILPGRQSLPRVRAFIDFLVSLYPADATA